MPSRIDTSRTSEYARIAERVGERLEPDTLDYPQELS